MRSSARSAVRALRLPLLCLLFLSLAGFVPTEAFAQGSTAALSGRVTDPQGLALPGVTVTVTNPSTGDTRRVVTNEAGRYQLTALQPGRYNVTLDLAGFKQLVFEGVVLTVGADARQDAQMEISAVTETVTVASTVTVNEYVPLGHSPVTRSVSGAVAQLVGWVEPAPLICSLHTAAPPLLFGVRVTLTEL